MEAIQIVKGVYAIKCSPSTVIIQYINQHMDCYMQFLEQLLNQCCEDHTAVILNK